MAGAAYLSSSTSKLHLKWNLITRRTTTRGRDGMGKKLLSLTFKHWPTVTRLGSESLVSEELVPRLVHTILRICCDLQQMDVFMQGDSKFSISAPLHSTATVAASSKLC